MNLEVIAHIENGFSDKFGIPRQSREESRIESRIVFEPKYRVREALRGIEAYSHLWLIWQFHDLNNAPIDEDTTNNDTAWSPTVRPPRLGGNTRMGVFATRSPYRPNHLGLSSVRLLRVEESKTEGLVLVVSGADLLDGTPIFDIKPYLSFSDSHPDAINGFAEQSKNYRLPVIWDTETSLPEGTKKEIEEILSQDPRPSYQSNPARIYKMDYAGARVGFKVQNEEVHIIKCEKIN